ncbi:MAG: hypothetical protein LBI33_04760, partial [Propionibacteriaceae bacterium]|nr:hypothetical protein [Propionibacteriaceae bacterium]
MRNTRPRARYGWLSLVTAVLSCVAGFAGVGWPAPPAHAAESAATVTFASVVTDDTGVTLTGTVTNTGTNPLYNAQVVFWHQIAPLTTTDQLNDALAADPTADTGDRLPESPAVIASGKNTFGPGQTAYFTVSASWADLKVSGDGAYLVGVHVRGAVTVRSALSTVGRGRTLVTMATTTTAAQATVVMLTSAPSRLHDNIFTDDHLAGELAGRLTTLLGLAHLGGVSWVIDPALYSEIATMASGYQVQGIGPSELVAGTGEAAAAAWLTSFATLDPASGYRLPWGNPDLGFGLATHNTSLLIDKTETLLADTATAPVAPTATPGSPATPAPPTPDPIDIAHLPLLIHPANNLVNSDFLTYIAPLEPDIVLAATPASTTLDHGSLLATQTTAYPDGPGPDDAHT